MTNSNKGYVYNTSKSAKNFDNGLFASVYNYLISKDVNSIEAEITAMLLLLILL
jgi:hypothetical protein